MPQIQLDGAEIYYAQAGQGHPALLFIHGAGADHTLWGEQISTLSKEFTVVALDLSGHGQSPARNYGISLYAQEARAVCAALRVPTVLVGHSMGGAVAMTIALDPPKNLTGLVLVGTGAKLRVHPQILELCQSDFARACDLIVTWAFALHAPSALRSRSRAQLERNGAETLWRDFASCNSFDVMDRLSELRLPTLIVCGTEDQLTPLKYSEYLQAHIAGAQLRTIEDAGHMVMLEQPAALNQVLRDFCISLRGSLQ